MRATVSLTAAWCNLSFACSVGLLFSLTGGATAEVCEDLSGLADGYIDQNCDLLADRPVRPAELRDPNTLVWAYTPIEDPTVYAELFRPFTRHLANCVGRQIVYYPVQSEEAQVRAFANGRLHFAGFATGATVSAVEQAGAHPFAAKGSDHGNIRGYRLIALVRASSAHQTLSDLAGFRVAHTTEQSNSGNHAPRRYFPEEGLSPGTDYQPILSGGHAQSILGLLNGDYDMAAVASDVFDRMSERGRIKRQDFRILYESPLFPTSSFAFAHDLTPELSRQLQNCFFNFDFPERMSKEFHGDNRFVPVDYQADWQAVRDVLSQDDTMPN